MAAGTVKRWLSALRPIDLGDKFARRGPVLFIASFALLLLTGAGAAVMARLSAEAERWVAHTLELQNVAHDFESDVQDVESGMQAYVITQQALFLDRYDQGLAAIAPLMERLRALTLDDAQQRAVVANLAPIVETRVNHARSIVDLMRRGKRDEAVDVVNSGAGKALMDRIRGDLKTLVDHAVQQLTRREANASYLRSLLFALIIGGLVGALLLALLVAYTVKNHIEQLRQRTTELEAQIKGRQEAETALRQAQKMDAIGQLTGGIAHDFNNALTIIMGNLDTMKRRLDSVPQGQDARLHAATLARSLDAALHGAANAAQLTHRLLAFARQQPLAPARCDLNRVVEAISELLHRTVGEAIKIESVLTPGLWPVIVDANQLDNCLINLVVNARDAMPDGGRITIETANLYLDDAYAARFGDVTPGQYAMLSVSDTGCGIPPELLNNVFEPFFTTKAAGKGSGLGLAMCHGFIKQSGGHIRLYSEVGQGTSVKIYLPRFMAAEQEHSTPAEIAPAIVPHPVARPEETVLLVEDDPDVRDYAASALGELGYRVLEAEDGQQALHLLATAPRVDLLFTDVVLRGGLNGRQLADKMLATREVPVLFTTGYTRNAIVHHGRLDADVSLLNKPYTQQDLARMVRQLLDKTPRLD